MQHSIQPSGFHMVDVYQMLEWKPMDIIAWISYYLNKY